MEALRTLGAPGLRALIAILGDDKDWVVKRAIICLRSRDWGPAAKTALPALKKLTVHKDDNIRSQAEHAIAWNTRKK